MLYELIALHESFAANLELSFIHVYANDTVKRNFRLQSGTMGGIFTEYNITIAAVTPRVPAADNFKLPGSRSTRALFVFLEMLGQKSRLNPLFPCSLIVKLCMTQPIL